MQIVEEMAYISISFDSICDKGVLHVYQYLAM